MSGTLITSEVDFSAQGKQQGYLRVPHSTHRSAYGWIGVPVSVIANGEGPTLLAMAGNHGDEYEGQIALGNLIRRLDAGEISGRLIVLPMLNAPAARAGLRTSPLDGGNLNRLFPGDPRGTPSEMIAHYVEHELMPLADYLVDLHSGGSSLFYPPTLLRGKGVSPEETAALMRMQEAFDLPYAWVFGGGGRGSTARTALGAGNRNGVIGIMAELGGGGEVNREILAQTERGLMRLLQALGLLQGADPEPPRGTRELVAEGSVPAYEGGLFEPLKDIAEPVAKGEVVARIHHPEAPWKAPGDVVSPFEGIVLARRALGQVELGDAVFQIARDRQEDTGGASA